MAVPPADLEPAPFFALLAKLARDHGLTGVSMGMSGDYATAVELGATCVRVGSALFGARDAAPLGPEARPFRSCLFCHKAGHGTSLLPSPPNR